MSDTLLHQLCYCEDNEVIFNYATFKAIAGPATYPLILKHIYALLQKALLIYPKLIVRAHLKSITIGDMDTHKHFILDAIKQMSVDFSDALDICYLYKTPFVFSQIYSIVSIVIDKETKQKIQIVKN